MTTTHDFPCGADECEPCERAAQGYFLALDELAKVCCA